MKRSLLLIALASLVMGSCYYEIPIPKEDKADELIRKSKEKISIDGHDYRLEAYLWRDFMPISPPDGQPLIAINRLVEVDGRAIPDGIDMVRQYVIFKEEVWESEYTNEVSRPEPHILERISREGPKWGPHVWVTVISLVRDDASGEEYLVRVEDVWIERTD